MFSNTRCDLSVIPRKSVSLWWFGAGLGSARAMWGPFLPSTATRGSNPQKRSNHQFGASPKHGLCRSNLRTGLRSVDMRRSVWKVTKQEPWLSFHGVSLGLGDAFFTRKLVAVLMNHRVPTLSVAEKISAKQRGAASPPEIPRKHAV